MNPTPSAADPPSELTLVLIGLLVYGLIAWAAWGLGRQERDGWFPRPSAGELRWALLVLPSLAFDIGAFWTFWWFVGELSPGALEAVLTWFTADPGGGSWELVETVLLGILVFPVVEEMFFRGALLPALARKLGAGRALVLQALLFGCLHANPLGTAAFALLAGLLYLRTRSLWAPILFHVLGNALAIVPWTATSLWRATPAGVMGAFRDDLPIAMAMLAISIPPLVWAGRTLWRQRRIAAPTPEPAPELPR